MTVRVEAIPTKPGMGRSIIEHDDRSREFAARGTLFREGAARRNRTHRRGRAYDQGETSSCVGQTVKGVLNTAPLSKQVAYGKRTKYDAFQFYREGQDWDEWAGEEPEYYGTSANGVCKYLRHAGVISEYRWCFGLDDVIDTLVQHGPVAIGTYWWTGMWDTDPNGFIIPTGRREGGHETELIGVNVDEEYVIGMNSWGPGWGEDGRYKISWAHLDTLLRDDGDALTITALPQPVASEV